VSILIIRKVVENCDFRTIHRPRLLYSTRYCRTAEDVVLLVNKRRSNFRLVANDGSIHTWYPELGRGERIDVDKIQALVRHFGGISLLLGRRRGVTRKKAA
jgi:hypothetical protein